MLRCGPVSNPPQGRYGSDPEQKIIRGAGVVELASDGDEHTRPRTPTRAGRKHPLIVAPHTVIRNMSGWRKIGKGRGTFEGRVWSGLGIRPKRKEDAKDNREKSSSFGSHGT